MAIVKKFKDLLDLDDIDVLIDEEGVSKHIIVSDMPESLPQGRSSFLIETSPFMKSGVEIQMDFIDSEGDSIYTEPVSDYLEGTARRVFIEVYNDTAPGIATLIIVGELESVPEDNTIFSDADPVPEEYEGHYNVRLTKQVIINPTAVNTQPIKFFTQPTAKITETQLGTMVRTEITGSITSSLFNIEGVPTDTDLLYKPYGVIEEEAPQGTLSETTTTPPSKQKNVKAYIETKKLKFKKGSRKNTAGKRSGFTSKRSSPAKFPYQLKIGSFDGDETFRFNTKHIGGEVHFHTSSLGNLFADETYYPTETLTNSGLLETPTFDILKEQSVDNLSPTHYTASIVDLINDQTALVELPFTNKNVNGENIVLPIFGKGEIFFEAMPTGSYAAANLVSYADVQLSNMRTFSGDVFKIKAYVKSEGGFDDYKLLAEVPLEGKELLIDSASVGQGERTGYPIKQSDVSDYWDAYGGIDGLYEMPAAAADLSASYSNETLLDSFQLSGSTARTHDSIRFQLKDNYSFQLTNGLDYTLSANIVGTRSNTGALLMMYISGSSMYQQEKLHHNEFTGEDVQEPIQYGKRLGVLEVGPDEDVKKDFGLLVHNFTPDVSGSGVLQLRAVSGQWNISDISITPADDTGFSPSFFQFAQELPASLSHKRPDKFEFLIEFYDVNNNISDTVVYSKDNTFQGTNMTITGNDNVLESSLFIGGDTIGGGMHLGGVTSTLPETGGAGAEGSGFMRSVGYEGFISASAQSGSYGFMIYSGSVLPDSGDAYSGVGLELVGANGSFKFRTNPSIFDVRADTFFIGNTDIQYVSGSVGNIEISSSQFHLDPKNDRLVIGADAIINADLTANTIRTPATIGVDGDGDPAQSTDLNASSSINSQGLARFVSASIGGWTVGTGSIESAGGSLVLDPAGRQFRVNDGSNDRVHIGQVAADEYGMKVFDGTGVADSDILVELGEGGNNIAGWTIGAEQLTGGNMIIDKEGTIKSANYQKDVAGSGFILTSNEGGFLEVENAKIRGTMATTTFEKESVNAVGGQLYVANSTTLTSSVDHPDGNYPATETTMSVTNVSGFATDEILVLKKITDTGFNTEYVKVLSSSVNNPGDDTDLTGNLFLVRGYSGSTPSGQDSSSLGDSADSATFYSGSQVIVSTGKIGTGFIRLNANPNDSSTPYIDIVERTGSAIYDAELKVRLGDLSGVAGTRNVPTGFEGFGLMSEVAFLSGSNIKLEAPTFLLGDLNQNFVSGSNSNIEISSSKFHLTPEGELSIGFVDTDDGAAYLLRIEEEVTCSLDHHYKFDGPTSTTLSSGSNITDEITSGTRPLSTTTDHSGVEYRRGIVGQSIYTSGSAFYALDTGPTTNDIDFSLAMWFNADDVHFNVNEQLLLAQSSTENGINLWITGSNLYGSVYDASAGSGDQTVVNYPVDSGEWYHTALTYKASEDKLILYLNGVNVDEATLDADTTINVGNVNTNETMVAGVRGGTRFNYGSSTTTSVSDTSNTAGPTKNSFTGYVDDVRLYSQRLTPAQVVSLATVTREKAFHFNPITEEVQINSKKFFFGNDRTQYVSGSNGNIEISSSNFHVTAEGQITASSMNLKGISKVDDVSVADYFAFRFIEVTTSNDEKYLEEFTADGKTYWRLVLDGSLGGDMGMFVKLTNLDAMTERPIGQIIPPSQNNAGVTGIPPQTGAGSGHRIVIEASAMDVHFTKNVDDGTDRYDNGYSINTTSNHMVGFGFQRIHTVSSTVYPNTLKVAAGGLIDLVKSENSWFVQTLSSLEDIGLQSPGGVALFNVDGDSSFAGAGGMPFAPFVFAGDATAYHNGTMFVTGNPTVRQDANLHLATSASLYTSASIALQSGDGNLFFMGVTHGMQRMSFGNKSNTAIDADPGELGDVGYAISTNGSQTWMRDNLYLLGDVSSSATPAERLKVVDSSGNAIVRIDNQSTSNAAELLRLDYPQILDGGGSPTSLGASGHPIMVRVASDIIYELRGDGSGGSTQALTFTGGHDTSCKDDDDLMPGLIVRSTGVMWAHPTSSYETALPFTELCQTNGAKDVFGVIAGHLPEYHTSASLSADNITGSLFLELSGSLIPERWTPYLKNGWVMHPSFSGYANIYPTGSGNFHLHTNSIGEGSVWVTNINGEIESGDYIESSVIKGYGRKQGDDIMRSKTVAKCLENIDWDNISDTITYSGSAYKKHLAGVTFHCG